MDSNKEINSLRSNLKTFIHKHPFIYSQLCCVHRLWQTEMGEKKKYTTKRRYIERPIHRLYTVSTLLLPRTDFCSLSFRTFPHPVSVLCLLYLRRLYLHQRAWYPRVTGKGCEESFFSLNSA